MKRYTHKGFSLIELMIVVAIIGVLAAVAAPAYRNYIFKAKFTELMTFADEKSGEVNTFISTNGISQAQIVNNPCTNSTFALPATFTTASTWTIATSCTVTVLSRAVFPNPAGGLPIAYTVTMIPAIQNDGSVSWACGSGGSPYAPANCP